MYIALENNHRVRPSKDLRRAVCQCCNNPVIAKTGDKKVWHWAHEFLGTCSQKAKGEWHYGWQDLFNEDEVEVRDPKWPNNIADICIYDPRLPDGYLVIELQESAISLEDIHQRNKAYKHILWITNNLNNKSTTRNFNDKSLNNYVILKHDNTNQLTHACYLLTYGRYQTDKIDTRELFIQLYLKLGRDRLEETIKRTGDQLDSCIEDKNLTDEVLRTVRDTAIQKPIREITSFKIAKPIKMTVNPAAYIYKLAGFSGSNSKRTWSIKSSKLKDAVRQLIKHSQLLTTRHTDITNNLINQTAFYEQTFLNNQYHVSDYSQLNKCRV